MAPKAKKAAVAGRGGGRRSAVTAAVAPPPALVPTTPPDAALPAAASPSLPDGVPGPVTPNGGLNVNAMPLHGMQTFYSDVLTTSSKNRGDEAFLHSVDEALRRILRHPCMADIRQAMPRGVDTGHGGQAVHTHTCMHDASCPSYLTAHATLMCSCHALN